MSNRVEELRQMLTYCRPAGSLTERTWCERYLSPVAEQDAYGNWHAWRGPDDSPIVWSAHTDTVHRREGEQRVTYADGRMFLSRRARRHSECLGADDTVGCWILLQMFRAGVPGHYVWHYGEERGGIGSAAVTHHLPELYAEARAVIAFDRRGSSDVITHQMHGRCCSDAFAWSVCRALNLGHEPSDAGVFTDSANYTDIVGECTNISVGYAHEHRPYETVDVAYACALVDACIAADWSQLVYERRPGDSDPDDRLWGFGARPVSVATMVATCEYCRDTYDPWDSPAEEWDAYCSLLCETRATAQQRTVRDLWLDPDWPDVQAALKRGQQR